MKGYFFAFPFHFVVFVERENGKTFRQRSFSWQVAESSICRRRRRRRRLPWISSCWWNFTQFHVETSKSRVVDESFIFFYVVRWKRVWELKCPPPPRPLSPPPMRYKDSGKRRCESRKKKIVLRMITNFKSDYGNLLLSGLTTTELNILWQIKSGSQNLTIHSTSGKSGKERSLKRIKITITSFALYQIFWAQTHRKSLNSLFPGNWMEHLDHEQQKSRENAKTFRQRKVFEVFWWKKLTLCVATRKYQKNISFKLI